MMKFLTGLWLVFFLVLPKAQCEQASTAEVRGAVRDAVGGEPLGRVAVALEGTSLRTLTDAAGRFDLKALNPGDYTLRVATVGYQLALTKVHLSAGEVKEFEIALTPDNLRQTTTVQVSAAFRRAPH